MIKTRGEARSWPTRVMPASTWRRWRTPKVTGTFTLAGTAITKTSITADLSALESKDDAPPGAPALAARCDLMLEFDDTGDNRRRVTLRGTTRAGIEALERSYQTGINNER